MPSDMTRRAVIASSALTLAAAALPFAAHAAAPEIRPFRIDIPQTALDDLADRLSRVRWPTPAPVTDQSQGVPLARMKALVDRWRNSYDWRRVEAVMNGYPQFVTEIDGLDIHFLHVRSPHANARPLVMIHGWPGSTVEFLKVIGPLTDPTRHGGTADDAFHLVLPSLPGYGFSGKPRETGWGLKRIAEAWHTLMQRLGYTRYFAQGGDWGAGVTHALGASAPRGLAGLHANMLFVVPPVRPADPSPEEQAAFDQLDAFFDDGAGYAHEQRTRPQTIGYALADSPVGQAAWIYEKFAQWTDSGGDPETVLTKDEMLDDIMVYWLTNSAASSARLYWENGSRGFEMVPIAVPVGVTIFPGELYRPPRSWAERTYSDLRYFNKAPRGGHFAAFEQPEIFVNELRAAFRTMPF